MNRQEAISLRKAMEAAFEKATPSMTADEAIEMQALCKRWESGKHKKGDVYKADGQLWECIQDYDNAVYPDVVPSNSAWATFNKPYHGTTKETAMPYVSPTGAHDMYLAGEYMAWTDGNVYRCVTATAYSPEEYAAAWEVA